MNLMDLNLRHAASTANVALGSICRLHERRKWAVDNAATHALKAEIDAKTTSAAEKSAIGNLSPGGVKTRHLSWGLRRRLLGSHNTMPGYFFRITRQGENEKFS